jgi:glucose-1-phosphate thymidylyltransferase
LIITTPHDQAGFIKLLGDGSQIGCNIEYVVQPSPDGLAQAFILGDQFIGNDPAALVLGDNIFYGSEMGTLLKNKTNPDGGVVFAYHVSDPERYGVVEFDNNFKAVSIEENLYSQNLITLFQDFIFMITTWLKLQKTLSHPKRRIRNYRYQ